MVRNAIGCPCRSGRGLGRGHGNCDVIDDEIAVNLKNVLFANGVSDWQDENVHGAIIPFKAKVESNVLRGSAVMGDSPIAVEEKILRGWDSYWTYAINLEVNGDGWPRLHLG